MQDIARESNERRDYLYVAIQHSSSEKRHFSTVISRVVGREPKTG